MNIVENVVSEIVLAGGVMVAVVILGAGLKLRRWVKTSEFWKHQGASAVSARHAAGGLRASTATTRNGSRGLKGPPVRRPPGARAPSASSRRRR